MQNMQEIPGDGFSGQLPHSHIGELKCVQITRENIPSELNVCKIPHSHIGELKCMQNTTDAQPHRRGRVYAEREGDLR